MTDQPPRAADQIQPNTARKPLDVGEHVRVDGYDGVWTVVTAEQRISGTIPLRTPLVEVQQGHGILLVVARKCHRGRYMWIDEEEQR